MYYCTLRAETVALMGAHSLGGMNVQNSGYNGAFSMVRFWCSPSMSKLQGESETK